MLGFAQAVVVDRVGGVERLIRWEVAVADNFVERGGRRGS